MYTSDPYGILTAQFPNAEDLDLLYVSEVNIPLLEGGIEFTGAISLPFERGTRTFIVHVPTSVLQTAQVREIEPGYGGSTSYWVRLGNPDPENPEEGTFERRWLTDSAWNVDAFEVDVERYPEDPQQFSGMVRRQTPDQPLSAAKFIYKDIRDLGFGVIVVTVVGIAAVMCASTLIIGKLANSDCRRAKVTYNFRFNLFAVGPEAGTKLGCDVVCLDPPGPVQPTDKP